MKNLLNIFYALLICMFSVGLSTAQPSKAEKKAEKAAELKRIVDAKSYVFKANTAIPTGTASVQVTGSLTPNSIANALNGSSVALTSQYDLTLSNDTLRAFLPYYGVAYTAPPMSSTEGGVKFTTTTFDYKVTEKKNGNIEILFKSLNLEPRSPSDVQRMILTVSAGGYANLQIILLNRQPISYTGTLEEVKPKKES